MPVLFDTYTPNSASPLLADNFETVKVVTVEQWPRYNTSISYIISPDQVGQVNSKHLLTLEGIRTLENNWDNDDALKPTTNVIEKVKSIILLMNTIGQKIYTIAPGPWGEIMVDLRNDEKSLEIIIYPDKQRYVKLGNQETRQGEYRDEFLPYLLTWLNQ